MDEQQVTIRTRLKRSRSVTAGGGEGFEFTEEAEGPLEDNRGNRIDYNALVLERSDALWAQLERRHPPKEKK
tara:strand:- start:255 stop:470 length:216 start_codon:yes stop_codon:yes gene_type:complete